ncbi:hypothetical protein B0H66DRAFT_733 [Apodospora peruviana]|uniref:Uncharacterized protein n=1 Tax=Apodospora peruviana TaxID=516989 RepID=A0AAE0IP46_9PEZI|nr:hypothetical protein B0H66DRAFT_733 [Apodospora peruviana]
MIISSPSPVSSREDSRPNLSNNASTSNSTAESSPAWTSPTASTLQTIIFGLVASLVALAALYLAYQQLRAMRHRTEEPQDTPFVVSQEQRGNSAEQTDHILLESWEYTIQRIRVKPTYDPHLNTQ